MRGAKLGLFVLMFFLVAPVVVTAYSGDTCSPTYSASSWMNNLTVIRLFDNSNDYKWKKTWNPRSDADWQQDYCGPSRILVPGPKLEFDSVPSPQ